MPTSRPTICPTCKSTSREWNGTVKMTPDGWIEPNDCLDKWHD